MKRLRTMFSWAGAAMALVPIALVLVVCPFFLKRERWEPLLKKLCRALARAFGYHVRIRGLENLPQTGGFVLVCKHVNLIVAFLILASCQAHSGGWNSFSISRGPSTAHLSAVSAT